MLQTSIENGKKVICCSDVSRGSGRLSRTPTLTQPLSRYLTVSSISQPICIIGDHKMTTRFPLPTWLGRDLLYAGCLWDLL